MAIRNISDTDKAFCSSSFNNYDAEADYIRNNSLPESRHQPPSWDENMGPEFQRKRNLILEEKGRALAKQGKFFEAISCLEEIVLDHDDADLFSMNLLKAECYIQLGRETKAMKSIREVKMAALVGPPLDPDLLISLGESLGSRDSFLRSIIMFRIASDVYKDNQRITPKEKVDGIARCIQVSKDILAEASTKKAEGGGLLDLLNKKGGGDAANFLKKAMEGAVSSPRVKVIILDFGVEFMKEMLKDLKSIQGVEGEGKVLKEAWSATHIGFVLANVEEFDQSYKIRKQGTEAMEAALGDRAAFHHVYSVLLHNMGIVLHNSRRYSKAKEVYEKAIIAKEKASDHGGLEREKDIEETRRALEVTKKHMLLA